MAAELKFPDSVTAGKDILWRARFFAQSPKVNIRPLIGILNLREKPQIVVESPGGSETGTFRTFPA